INFYLCNMLKRVIWITLAGALLMLCAYCANMKAPGGGPRDIYAPQVLESDPPNYTTHFEASKIVLKFNEFVTVSDVTKEVFISPPLQNTPDIKTRGKLVIITIDEELYDSTTYSIFFGKSIKDLTEGNPIENYNYVFSTGDKIDSLSVIGEVINAFDLKPREDVLVMLYEDDNDTIPFDSLPYLVKPAYLTRTNPAGFYVINNLRGGDYMMFALADDNLSATYDQANEDIAFLDSLIAPIYMVREVPDSLQMDSLAMLPEDTLVDMEIQGQAELLDEIGEEIVEELLYDTNLMVSDLLIADSIPSDSVEEGFYTLFIFKETPDTIQRLLGADKPRKRVLRFIFSYPANDVLITPLTPVPDNWMLEEWNKGLDTLRYYIMSESLDTISLKISQDTTVFDTISFSLMEKDIPQRKKERKKSQVLNVISNTKSPFPYFENFVLKTGYPFLEYDFSRFILVEGVDSLQPVLEVYEQADRMIRLDHELKENTTYILFFPDSVLTDVLGRNNDSTEFRFNTNSYEDYGLYTLNVVNASPYEQLVIQLMTEKEEMVREEILGRESTINWDLLKPAKYIIKAFADLNHNGKWDTGDFLEKRQPEPVVYYHDVIEVRAGWSFEEDWTVEFK
ncbi:MAG: Ig-like domain-containing protein, partial [Bacteroidales bacterium]|nr:Ig-like domain-containing protein [Bacteroidales bacterium]